MHLRLYTTLGCHLCSALEAWLDRLANEPVTLERVEISTDEALMQHYAVRIPVLVDTQGQELDRGFEPARLAEWLAERGWLDAVVWQKVSQGVCEEDAGAEKPRGAHLRQGRRYLK
ncbi:MAG: glutaredoxin family protein [Halomonas sp.]|uniref:glutaredoxin family protein n=1 Tax=Halomonas sp. TaxID=1486246 RepID=UPI003F8E5929